jgi:Fic family protein
MVALTQLLTEIDALKAELDSLRPLTADQEARLMQKMRLDLNYHSNAIEGNQLTFGETKAFLLHGVTAQGKPFRDYLEIRGHDQALDYLAQLVRNQEPLTEAVIRELHKIILVEPYDIDVVTLEGRPTKKRIQPGQYKTQPNHVRTSTGAIHYYATPEETPANMAGLVAWYRREKDNGNLHPLVLAATFHYEFVTIHPFDDGNGRMARLLLNLILMQAGYPPLVVRLEQKGEYLLALEQADADNDLEPFIRLMGQALLDSLKLVISGAAGKPIEEQAGLDEKITLLQQKLKAANETAGEEE